MSFLTLKRPHLSPTSLVTIEKPEVDLEKPESSAAGNYWVGLVLAFILPIAKHTERKRVLARSIFETCGYSLGD